MNVAEINTVNYGSTGKIMLGIQSVAKENGIPVVSYYALGKENKEKNDLKRIGTVFQNKLNSRLAHVTGMMGCFSVFPTLELIRELKKNNTELIHLHNIHVSFLNYPLFFRFIKKNDIKVVWTLHDCWTFTGHCPHFTYPKCEKWMSGCHDCPRYREYPVTSLDNSKFMYSLKKKTFTGVKNMTLVTPSAWLKELAEKSFMGEYPIRVINNGIDTGVFRPSESDFREKYGIGNKFMILGVAFDWGDKKGLDVFLELEKRLDKEKFSIVLVGTGEKTDALLPEGIISIHKTENAGELAGIYTAADVFLNPTREEVLGLVNIEANACGTPVIMFRTGGSPECISEKTGIVVDVDDVNAVEKCIRELEEKNKFLAEDCIARAKNFEMSAKYSEYVELYKQILL
ncbi:MAG: glycosyltransferase [Oscillospiraceae bacterium]|nr:glycosyltransferase [Oscillospiraceae bacterium]